MEQCFLSTKENNFEPIILYTASLSFKILKEMGIPDHLTCLLRNLDLQVKKQQLEPDMEQWTGPKLGMGYIKVVYCHLAYLTYMQSTSRDNARLDEAQAGIKIAGRNINNLRYADDTILTGEGNGNPLQCSCLENPRDGGAWWAAVSGVA